MQNELQNALQAAQNSADQVKKLAGAALEESKALMHETVREDDYIEIQNLMNRYASYHYYAEHGKTYEYFALDDPRTTAELGSTGVYKGRTKIYQMFQVYHDYNNQPGTAHLHPLNTPLVHVAADGETAKGYWFTNGLEVLPAPPGQPPLSMWFLDAYGMTFVKTKDGWRWLHFHMLDDLKAIFPVSWSVMNKEKFPGPSGLIPPSYTTGSYEPYWSGRKPSLDVDSLPEAYEHLDE